MPSFFLTSAAKGKRVVLWTLLCFAASQLALTVYLDRRLPEVRDPLYGERLRSLRARLAEAPNAPLFLVLGSSRVKYSVRPEAMNVRAPEDKPSPIVYNFGINGMGTIRELMYFRRLLADGVRPRCLLLEVWPPLWAETGFFQESRLVRGEDDLHWRDVPLLCRYYLREPDLLRLAAWRNFLPLFAYRARLLGVAARPLLSRQQIDEMNEFVSDCRPVDRGGWFPIPWETSSPDNDGQARRDADAKVKPLLQQVRIDSRSDAALRELLAECRQHGIETALILMPEHSLTLGWYSPQARTAIRTYLARLRDDYGVQVVDTRTWAADDDFADLCHMRRKGVPAFSERLGREVVQPLLDGKPLAKRVLFSY